MTFYESKMQEYKGIVEYLKIQLETNTAVGKMLEKIEENYYKHYFPRIKGESEDLSYGEISNTYVAAYESVHKETNKILDDFASAINTTWNRYSTAKERFSYYTTQVDHERAQAEQERARQNSKTKK